MYGIKPVRHVRVCGRCGKPAVTTGTIGPSRICDACADKLLAVIWGAAWPGMKAHLASLGKFSYPGADLPTGRNRRHRGRRR